MEILAYGASLLIGVALGLIGGGGSILTLPVLVYLFRIDVVLATAYSLFIVGITSAVGSVQYYKERLVHVKTAIRFGIPSIITVFLTRAFLVPLIPDQFQLSTTIVITKATALMMLFAIMMLLSAYFMIKPQQISSTKNLQFGWVIVEGMVVGVITGLIGAGGGFLIIPVLIMVSKLPMKEAIGTSLVIIAAKSLLGFLGEVSHTVLNWSLLLTISGLALAGIMIGMRISKHLEASKLKPAFGWMILVMGFYVIFKEVYW
jgi:uncharacterized membrane protein YfcA